MLQSKVVKTEWTLVWIQPDGPNTRPRLLGCAAIDALTNPKGAVDRTNVYDSVSRSWHVVSRRQQAPDAPTVTIDDLLSKAESYFENAMARNCPKGVYVMTVECPPNNLFLNYDRALVLEDALGTQETFSSLKTRDTNEDSTFAADLDMASVVKIFKALGVDRVSGEDEILRDIAACGADSCAGPCGGAEVACDLLYAVADSAAGPATANVIYSADGGTTWAATSADPFAAGLDIASVVCFQETADLRRVIAARGDTVALTPPAIAYADIDPNDPGTTAWTVVEIGADDTEYFAHSGALCALDRYNIWAGTTGGEIWKSEDGGVTWELQATMSDPVNYIRMVNASVGVAVGGTTAVSNFVAYTYDGGNSWIEMVDPVSAGDMIWSVAVIDEARWWVGVEDGSVWYTNNAGATWAERAIYAPAGGTVAAVHDMFAWDAYNLWLTAQYAVGAGHFAGIQRSFNGGHDWEGWDAAELDDGTAGLMGMVVCGPNQAFAVGNVADVSTEATVFEVINPIGS